MLVNYNNRNNNNHESNWSGAFLLISTIFSLFCLLASPTSALAHPSITHNKRSVAEVVPCETDINSNSNNNNKTMSIDNQKIVHLVLFKYKKGTSQDDIKRVAKDFFSLKEKCVDAETGKPYIVSLRGGLDNSPEGLQQGYSHGYVVEFKSTFDRDYYVNADPAHQSFKDMIAGLKEGGLEKAHVLDFEDGVF